MKDINKLVISGGAINVYYILGALDVLYRNGKLDNINCYAGASIGAMVSILLSIGWSPRKIADEISEISSNGIEWNYSNFLNILINFIKGSEICLVLIL